MRKDTLSGSNGKNTKRLGFALLLLILLQMAQPVLAAPEPTSDLAVHASFEVLILNSYHPGYSWTESLEDTLMGSLKTQFPGIDISSEYLDWKRHPDEANIALLLPLMRERYGDSSLDLVLTTDDAALTFALDNREQLFRDVPVVYCGVTPENARFVQASQRNVTGVAEQFDIRGTIGAALTVKPETKQVVLVYDNMETGVLLGMEAEKNLRELAPSCEVVHWNMLSADEIRKKAQVLSEDAIILFMAYNRDANGLSLTMDQFGEMMFKDASVPVFSVHDFMMGHQVLGGSVLSGPRHATVAAGLAGQVLEGTSPDMIPFTDELTVSLQFDYNQMRQFHVSESDLPPGAEVLNHPFSFYRTYRVLVWSVLTVFFLLLLLMAGLVVAVRARKRAAELLRSRNTELEAQKQLLEQSQETIRHMAYYDSLTGLPNRILLRAVVEEAVATAASSGEGFVLIFADMDNFKVINDSFGHPTGDKVLRQIAERMEELLPVSATFGRTGGDEFALILPCIDGASSVETFAQQILAGFKNPFEVEGMRFHMGVSLGIARYPYDGTVFDALMRSADTAMYAAKNAGKNQYRWFDHGMDAAAKDRFTLEDGLRHALERNELQLFFQPIHRLEDNGLSGFEALLRWHSPEHGWVTPDRFIPIAEETGLIVPIGEWVLREGCRFVRRVGEQLKTGIPGTAPDSAACQGFDPSSFVPEGFHLAVNVSVLQLMQVGFTASVMQVLSEEGISPEHLILEITESVLVESFEENAEQLRVLSQAGIRIALDDFGTGYSSLTYLQRLPIQILKIDKSFIDSITHAEGGPSHAASIISLAREWGFVVVAEGVELEAQRSYLKRARCDFAQGYLLSRPLPQAEALAYLDAAAIPANPVLVT